MTINERKKAELDPQTYERIYELLEAHTFTTLTDEWSRVRSLDEIEELPLRQFTDDEMVKLAEANGLSPQKAVITGANRRKYTMLRIGNERCLVTLDVMKQILTLKALTMT